MNIRLLIALGLGCFALISRAQAQLAPGQTRMFEVTGTQTNTGATTRLAFTLSLDAKVLTVVVDNNSTYQDGPAGGRLTMFGFNVPTFIGSLTLSGPSANWHLAKPYDPNAGGNGAHDEDVGAFFDVSNNPNIQSGGTSGGIFYGNLATFVFTFQNAFTAAQTSATADGFFTPFPATGNRGPHPGVTGRWQSIGTGGASDEGFGSELPIPEPSTYGLLASGVLALGVVIKKRRRSLT